MPVKIAKLPSKDELDGLFSYDAETGMLTRLATGKPVLGSRKRKHVAVGVGCKTFLAHRIIWKMVTGEEAALLDHIDCDGHNNRWVNLREAETRENLRNRGAPKNNTSGIKGVSFDKITQTWRASITIDRKAINLGRYPTLHEAAEVRRIAAERLHGEFARAA
jgi:hypothetical protein